MFALSFKSSKIIYFFLLVFCISNSGFSQTSGWYQQRFQVGDSLLSVNFVNSQTGWVCGKNSLILKSTNGGTDWNQQATGFNNTLENIYFPSILSGYTSGQGGLILKTTNQGINWIQQNSGTTNYLKSMSFVNDSTGYIAGMGNTILKTTNGGENWINKFIDDSLEFFSIYFINENTGWVSSRLDPNVFPPEPGLRIYKTTNGAENWFAQYERTIEHTPILSLNFINEFYGWAFFQYGAIAFCDILKTTDGGNNWSTYGIGPNNYFSIYFANETKGWAVGDYNGPGHTGIKFTSNGGTDWIYQNNPDGGHLHSVFFIDSLTGWAAGERGKIFKTTTGGILTDFTNISSEIPKDFSLSQNYPNPFNPKTIINYQCAIYNDVSLKVFDVLGNEVAELVNEKQNAGSYSVEFDGSGFASGIYFYSLITDGVIIDTKRMILLK
ncbi:MAG: T9SS type A sorting domain-containing protein [Ignavibacteria bacterium]|nr:T9SS type A sorting domain-containing protein [Ignavibacteria bacterium]